MVWELKNKENIKPGWLPATACPTNVGWVDSVSGEMYIVSRDLGEWVDETLGDIDKPDATTLETDVIDLTDVIAEAVVQIEEAHAAEAIDLTDVIAEAVVQIEEAQVVEQPKVESSKVKK